MQDTYLTFGSLARAAEKLSQVGTVYMTHVDLCCGCGLLSRYLGQGCCL